MSTEAQIEIFIERWRGVTASELSTAQSFVIDLCGLLGLDKPHATAEQDYMFERPITFHHGDGTTSAGRIDCYKRGHFVLEAKKWRANTQTKGFDDAMLRARAQGENYARALPATEGRPPFVVVVDVGHVIELYAEFSRSGSTYVPFPDPRRHRITLDDLRQDAVRERLRLLWSDPMALDPSRVSARVTREVATELADIARALERDGHPAHDVAAFLTRCLFSMFAEDIGLLPSDSQGSGAFTALLQRHHDDPPTLQAMMAALWAYMDHGGFSAALAKQILRFNGKLFKGVHQDRYAILLRPAQIQGLIRAAQASWTEVEPAIFGTLLERALNPAERHALGAHYTPRAYVERLVMPTVIEPLRVEWADAQAAALLLSQEATAVEGNKREAKLAEACDIVQAFLHRLCTVRVLDPACGSGNFLYVTLEHLKRIEGEVLNQLEALGHTQSHLDWHGETVTLQQLRGIELNERAAALAELVLWIGWLQWHIRTNGRASVGEPVVHDYGNIEHRDAVLAYDEVEPLRDDAGQVVTRWDGVTTVPHPVTGLPVPDEHARTPQWRYLQPRQAEWPTVDFIVGNPPFIGASSVRAALGDGYAQALRSAWPEVPESADFVMHWWQRAAEAVRTGAAQRFGLITTNSIRQTFNRRVIEAAQNAKPPLGLVFAIPDHPWVDSADGAAVRIAMTVGQAHAGAGHLLQVITEQAQDHGEVAVQLQTRHGHIHADLRIGADLTRVQALRANEDLSNRGVQLFGSGFIVTPEQAQALGLGRIDGLGQHIRDYRNGRDLMATPRGVMVIDLFGLDATTVRQQYPAVYQWVLEHVKPERDQNNRATYRNNWWTFGEPRRVMRAQINGLPRYIATVETAKHRVFQFLDANILPDNMLIAIAQNDALHLGVLSSQVHVAWALAAGGRLGVGNDPRYNKSRCFETFPFPDRDTGLTPALAERIRSLAEQIDGHRKAQQAAHAKLSLTDIYNVLDKLRRGEALSAKDKGVHEQGLVAVLRTLHDELDQAVLAAYGWAEQAPVPWGDADALAAWTDQVLLGLVELNARRAADEAQGLVRWLRPDFQAPHAESPAVEQGELDVDSEDAVHTPQVVVTARTAATWAADLPAQIKAVAEVLQSSPSALSENSIAAHFKGKGRWRERLPTILASLEALGRAQQTDADLWRGL